MNTLTGLTDGIKASQAQESESNRRILDQAVDRAKSNSDELKVRVRAEISNFILLSRP